MNTYRSLAFLSALLLIFVAAAGCLHSDDADEREGALTDAGPEQAAPKPPGAADASPPPGASRGKTVPEELKQQAVRRVGRREGVANDDLDLASASAATLPIQGQTVYQFKVMEKRSGKAHSVTLDEAGAEVDLSKLLAQEEEARTMRYGKLDPELDKRLNQAGPNERIPVAIRAKEGKYEPPDRPEANRIDPDDDQARGRAKTEADDKLKEARDRRKSRNRTVLASLEDRLTRLGEQFTADEFLPVLYAELTADAIRRVEKFPEVELILLAPPARPMLEIAKPTVGATYVNGTLGITGAGVRVAQIEVGGRVDTTNTRISSGLAVDSNASLCYPPGNTHATGVAGIIHSGSGVAPGTTLLATGDCNGDSNRLNARSSAAVTWGSKVQNHSWGRLHYRDPGGAAGGQRDTFLTQLDWFYDNLVFTTFTTVVYAAGNSGLYGSEAWVMSPARAYNVISVGNLDDKNTSSWSGDSMAASSSWIDPYSLNGDREEPDLAAPGQNTVRSGPFSNGNFYSTVPLFVNSTGYGSVGHGTSFAAPMVAGAAALLIQRQPTLGTWPEVIKAILMATALGNPDGFSPRYESSFDKRDGAGGIWIPYAEQISRGVGGNWRGVTYNCSTASPFTVMTISLAAGRSMRAVIAWDTHPQYANYYSRPSADLDLQIIGPTGAVVAQSGSYDNVHELVEFTPGTSGTYSMRVIKDRCDLGPTYLGAAWSQP